MEIRATFYPTGGSSGAGAGKSYDAACAPLQAVVLLAFDGCGLVLWLFVRYVCVGAWWTSCLSTIEIAPTQSKTNRRLKQDETLSLAALAERTRLPAVVLKPIIHSLACAKYKARAFCLIVCLFGFGCAHVVVCAASSLSSGPWP